MKTLPEILDNLGERYVMVEHRLIHQGMPEENGKHKEIEKAQEAIAKELMGIIGEDDDPWYEVNNANAAIAIKLNELRAEERARLTAFIGKGDGLAYDKQDVRTEDSNGKGKHSA